MGSVMDDARPERAVSSCLLVAIHRKEVNLPNKTVFVCGLLFCSARSDHIGDLPCKQIIDDRNKKEG